MKGHLYRQRRSADVVAVSKQAESLEVSDDFCAHISYGVQPCRECQHELYDKGAVGHSTITARCCEVGGNDKVK